MAVPWCALGAVDAGGAAELGDQHHDRFAPGRAHAFLDRSERTVEGAEQRRQASSDRTLVDVGVPAVEGERADPRPVGAGEELRGGAGGLGEIGAHLLDAAELDHRALILGLALDAAGTRQGGEADAVFEQPRQSRIGVAIEVEEAHGGFIAHRRSPRRHP